MKRVLFAVFALGLSLSTVACGKKAEPAPAEAKKEEAKKEDEPKPEPKKIEPVAAEPEAKKEEPTPEPTPAPAAELPPAKGAWKSIPNAEGLIADVPANAVDNGIGGAAGFHAEDGSFQITWREIDDPERAKMTIDAQKAETEQFAFKKWIKSEATADGWILVHEGTKIDNDGNEAGTLTIFTVRRKLGDKTFDCGGSLEKADGLDASIASCQSVRSK